MSRMKLSLLALILVATSALAEDWPQFMYNSAHSGNAADRDIDVANLGLQGAVAMSDGIYTSPVVADGKVFVVDGSGLCACFDAATLNAYEAHATRIETQLRPDGALRDLAGWGNKLIGKIVRLAALFHLMSQPDDREPWRIPASLEAFQRAARLADYLIAHARRAFGLMHESRELRAARKLMAHLASDRCRRFTTRDAHRIVARNETVETARSTLDLLAAHHQIARVAGQRRDSEAWVVHPAIVRQWERTPASPHAIQAGTDGTLA